MGAPERVCGNCEYYNGGGLSPDGKPIRDHGDCHNTRSPRFTTTVTETCDRFFACTTRWPKRAKHIFNGSALARFPKPRGLNEQD